MTYIPAALRRAVVARAHDRCEYCRLAQAGQGSRFHIDHIVPILAEGPTELENLALACVSCSLRKGSRVKAIDPNTQQFVKLFNPRRQRWNRHFFWQGLRILGHSAIGRATIEALQFNRPIMLAVRQDDLLLGRHPPRDD